MEFWFLVQQIKIKKKKDQQDGSVIQQDTISD